MIHIVGDRDAATTEIVVRAFERSFTRGQVRQLESVDEIPARPAVLVMVSPEDAAAETIGALLGRNVKIILQGPLSARLARIAGIETVAAPSSLAEAAACAPAAAHAASESPAALVYAADGLGASSPLRRRHFLRFDYADEWNNLGYGRIRAGEGPWSITQLARRWATPVAEVVVDGAPPLGAAVTLNDLPRAAVLWFARPVGAVDGQDWAVVEAFVSAHRAGGLPCRPYLRGIPHGYAAGVTMRLDCDEDIASARRLFEFYRSRHRPFSLAVATGQPEHSDNVALMREVHAAGGAILSHSVTHAPRWGGSAEAAEREARESKAWLESHIPGLSVRHAVSPFHQNPNYVPDALARAGYRGFVGGSIAWDPEYLMARAGAVPFAASRIVSHAQVCMLHGDCIPSEGDPLRTYKQAFGLARASGQFFGYLDHPFSARYAYGWPDEDARTAFHRRFLDFIESEGGPLFFVDEDTCLDFVAARAAVEITYDELRADFELSAAQAAGFPLSIGYLGGAAEVRP